MDEDEDFDDFMMFEAPMYFEDDEDGYYDRSLSSTEKLAGKIWVFYFILIVIFFSIMLCGGCT